MQFGRVRRSSLSWYEPRRLSATLFIHSNFYYRHLVNLREVEQCRRLRADLSRMLEKHNLNYETDKRRTPESEDHRKAILLFAAFKGEEDVVIEMINDRNDPQNFHCNNLNALHIAIIRGRKSCVEKILSFEETRDQWLERNTVQENSPLHLAALRKKTEIAKVLIINGASLSALNDKREMALSLVASLVPAALDSIESMLDSYISIDKNNEDLVRVEVERFQRNTSTDGQRHSANYGLSLLSCFITCKQTKFLNHPLCQIILNENWNCLKNLFYSRLFLSCVLLLTMTNYILVFHVFDCAKSDHRQVYAF